MFGRFVLFLCGIHILHGQNVNFGPSTHPEAYFNGSAYLRLQTIVSLKRLTGLSFRTCSGGSLFSQQQNDEILELSVNKAGVVFYARTQGKQYEETIDGTFLNNKWHLLTLEYKSGNLSMRLDSETKLIANSSYREAILNTLGTFNEGGAVLLLGKQFNGCLLEGPSLVFNDSIIMSSHNVVFEECPMPYDSCVPKDQSQKTYNYCVTEPCMMHGTCINGRTGYTCSCMPRYTGKNCEIDLGDPCTKSPPVCRNGATCTTSPTSSSAPYRCHCPPDFTGANCESQLSSYSPCRHNNPCRNGATCDDHHDGTVDCYCAPGFVGRQCELDVDDCKSNPCQNGAVCVDGVNNYTCDCTNTGYKGRFCEVNINECVEMALGAAATKSGGPCQNRGLCFDTYGGYLCACAPGYGGTNCQIKISECRSKPCLNHGICIDKSEGYTCRCLPGFGGLNCEIEERQLVTGGASGCGPHNCQPYGECVAVGNAATCICKPDYPGPYPNCTTETNCGAYPCKNGGTCAKNNCICPATYTGAFCQTKIDGCASVECQNGGVCVSDGGAAPRCNCTADWMGSHCEQPYDACAFRPCQNNASCVSSSATGGSTSKPEFTCECQRGYEGALCEHNVDDCYDVACPPGRVCVDLVNDYECRCPVGFAGENCTLDADPCAKRPCLNGGSCEVDAKNAVVCTCLPGFTGATCDIDIDECKTLPGICHEGICVNHVGGFQCYCKPGYTGERCNLDFDECLSQPCRNNATCLNKVNNYECLCPAGYDGKDCSVDINECEPMPCVNGSTCIDGINKFTCVCQAGLTGQICDVNIDDCESSPCSNGGHCIDGLDSFTCDCDETGYTGERCDINIDDCQSSPCENGAKCVDLVKDYRCDCYTGYTGKNCEEDVNECESNPCQFGGTCLERSNRTYYNQSLIFDGQLPDIFRTPFNLSNSAGYECLCVAGITGLNCEININECESSPCYAGTCEDRIGGYRCECDEGFEGERCDIDIDECTKYRPCQHGKCIDRKASYYCICDANYGGKNCTVPLIGCTNNPCLNNGTCKPYLSNEIEHKFNCTCPSGFHGDICEKVTTMSLSSRSLVVVNTSRDEGYDIQFRFKTTLSDGLLALGKGLTYYILELSRGRLNLHSSLLNKWEGVFIGTNLNDSQWQRVFVAINSTHLVLSANDEQTIYPITFNENYNTTYTSFPLTYIGGIPSNLRKLIHGRPFLTGCTEDVLINGEWLLPESGNTSLMLYQNVDVGCLRTPQCNPNPCYSGGVCTDLWRDFHCTCERPYLGHICQYNYTAATFGHENITDSLVTVTVTDAAKRAVRTIVDISMFIRTRQSRGQIFYLGSELNGANTLFDETYVAAQLESGELLVRIQFNGTPESYTVGSVKLDNGYNHLIEVIRNVTLVQVKLNGTEYFRKTISATGTLDAQILYLGGQPQLRQVRQTNDNLYTVEAASPAPPTPSGALSSPLSNVPFKGIIQDVQISNGSSVMVVEFYPLEAEDLEIPPPFGNVSFEKAAVLKGVNSDDLCRFRPCEHNGVCENTWNDYRCICPRGFKGKNCTDLEFCELEECPGTSLCKNLEDGFECIANATFDGKTAPLQYRLVHLTNTSAASKPPTFDTLELTYRTRSWGTLFFAKNLEDHFVIFIYHNEVVIEWQLGETRDSKRFRRDHFEGEWLILYFTYKDRFFKGGYKESVMDEVPNFELDDFNSHRFNALLRDGVVYLGGSDNNLTFDYQQAIDGADSNNTGYISASDTTTLPSNSIETDVAHAHEILYKVDHGKKNDLFKGCLGEIRIGGLLLPFFTTKQLYPKGHYFSELFELEWQKEPEIGCILCHQSECYNGGYCINPVESYRCNCTEGYTGDDCFIDINECEPEPCENNATCRDLVGRYECACALGFEGVNCENEINECLSNPCRHGGTCIDLIGAFKCDCPGDFVGKQCEAPLLITCDNKPCSDGSTCKTGPNELTGNNFTCICTEGMEGALCDTPFCAKKPCAKGNCITDDKSKVPLCRCQRGFQGKYCEVNVDDCISPTGASPCQNGGVCIDGINRYDCNCTGTGYAGLLCEMDIDECTTISEACGAGICQNLKGTFNCTCFDGRKCGHFCALDNPCIDTPCVHGDCVPQCTNQANYVCNCHENYTGQNCTDNKLAASSQNGGLNILYIIVPIVLIVVIAIVVAMAILINVARSKRATRGTYSPSAQEFSNPRMELDNVLKPPPEERLI